MGTETHIEWCDHTFNPWQGCLKVSPGCNFCYAEVRDHRFGHNNWGPAATTDRTLTSAAYWREPLKWNRAALHEGARRRVFCASLADVFEHHPQLDEPRRHLWQLIEQTPALDWLLLTKRPENISAMIPLHWLIKAPANVWFGTSVEDQAWADRRIPALLSVPATIHFLSCEPLLGEINLLPYLRSAISWVIAGGESGSGARPMDMRWAFRLRDDCENTGTAFFMKQMGSAWAKENGARHAKGGDITEFPIDLRIRRWPVFHPILSKGETHVLRVRI